MPGKATARKVGSDPQRRKTTSVGRSVDQPVLYGADLDALLALIVPQMPMAGGGLTAVPNDPAEAEIVRSTQELRKVAAGILARSVPDNTRKGYSSHIRAWAEWCTRRNVPALPGDVSEVLYFLTAYGAQIIDGKAAASGPGDPLQAHAVSSLGVRAAALARIHRNAGLPSPTDDRAVKELMTGFRRLFSVRPRNAKAAIDLAMLGQMIAVAAQAQAGHDRRWAWILLHQQTDMSVASARRLGWADIDLATRTLSPSDPSGQRRLVVLPPATDPRLDPMAVLARMRERAPHLDLVFVTAKGKPISRQALHQTLADARRIVPNLTGARRGRMLRLHADLVEAGSSKPLRDVALLSCGWWSALRRSELEGLVWGDMTQRQDGAWAVLIARSKTDQDGHGTTLFLPRAHDESICPSRAMTAWHEHVTALLGADPCRTHPDLPVFPAVDRYGRLPKDFSRWTSIDGHAINTLVQDLAALAGFSEPKSFGGHSLRAGFVTEALRDRKLTPIEVQEVTRHRSLDVLLGYRREIQAFETSPVHRMIRALGGS